MPKLLALCTLFLLFSVACISADTAVSKPAPKCPAPTGPFVLVCDGSNIRVLMGSTTDSTNEEDLAMIKAVLEYEKSLGSETACVTWMSAFPLPPGAPFQSFEAVDIQCYTTAGGLPTPEPTRRPLPSLGG